MSRREVQLLLESLWTDAGNGRALGEDAATLLRRASSRGLASYLIARKKSEMTPDCIGFYRGEGDRRTIYLLCPFHYEKTPSCVVYRKGRPGNEPFTRTFSDGSSLTFTPRPTMWTHFYCYSCAKLGSIRELCHALKNPVGPPFLESFCEIDPESDIPF